MRIVLFALMLLTCSTLASTHNHNHHDDDEAVIDHWDTAQTFREWENMMGNDQTLVLFVLPNEHRHCASKACIKKRKVLDQVAHSLQMDDQAKVAILVLPEGSNDIGTLFGPALKLAHSVISSPSLVFGIGLLKQAIMFQGEWKHEHILEAYIAAKSSDQPLDDTECLINDLDDIAMLALDKEANLDQLIIDAQWHAEIMDGFELECANIYLNVLNKIKDKGRDYVKTEKKRLMKLVASRGTSRNKRLEMQRKINVLGQFEMGDFQECQGPMCDRGDL